MNLPPLLFGKASAGALGSQAEPTVYLSRGLRTFTVTSVQMSKAKTPFPTSSTPPVPPKDPGPPREGREAPAFVPGPFRECRAPTPIQPGPTSSSLHRAHQPRFLSPESPALPEPPGRTSFSLLHRHPGRCFQRTRTSLTREHQACECIASQSPGDPLRPERRLREARLEEGSAICTEQTFQELAPQRRQKTLESA